MYGLYFVCGFVLRFVIWDRSNRIYSRTTTKYGDGTQKSHSPNLDRTKKSILASYSAVGNAVPWIYIRILFRISDESQKLKRRSLLVLFWQKLTRTIFTF